MRTVTHLIAALAFFVAAPQTLRAQPETAAESASEDIGHTPPRLSFVDGEVAFFRPAAGEWSPALVNTALAAGDRLRAGARGSLELQIGPQSFVRSWSGSAVALEEQGPGTLRFEVTEGRAALDLRELEPGGTVEVYTPHAAVAVKSAGYYRVEVAGDRTVCIVRDGGRAFVIPAEGDPLDVGPDEKALVFSGARPAVSRSAAPPRDRWDEWNSARTDYVLAHSGSRHLPEGLYGAGDLERHGSWQNEPEYGPVWVPDEVPAGWAPYSAGIWMHDPYYGWTWVDAAPWGWAPFHHGRWVFVGSRWCWAPGPRLVRPVYAPALVAFFSGPQGGAVIGHPGPAVGWVALGWGEPCVPWWGRPGFAHRPWWGGWGGPRVVNNVVIHRTHVVHPDRIHTYRNARVHRAVVTAHRGHFEGHGGSRARRFERADARDFRPMHGGPSRRLTPVGLDARTNWGRRPHDAGAARPADLLRPHRSDEERPGRDTPGRASLRPIAPGERRITPIPRERMREGERRRGPSEPALRQPVPDGRRPTPARPQERTEGPRHMRPQERLRQPPPFPAPSSPEARPSQRVGRPERSSAPPQAARESYRRSPAGPEPLAPRGLYTGRGAPGRLEARPQPRADGDVRRGRREAPSKPQAQNSAPRQAPFSRQPHAERRF